MTSRRLAAITAALGVSGALVAGGVAVGSSASAADLTKTATYDCKVLGTNELGTIPVTFTVTSLPTSLTQGVKAAAIPVTASTVVSPQVLTALSGLLTSFGLPVPSTIGGPISGNGALGSQALPFSATLKDTPLSQVQADGLHLDNIQGSINAFTPAKAGAQALKLPSAMTLNLLGASMPGADCTTTADTTVAKPTVKAAPAPVIASVKAPKTAKVGKSVKVAVTVKNATTGKVTAKLGAKKFTASLKAGKASVVVKGIKKGVNKIVVSFPKAASKTVKVTGKK